MGQIIHHRHALAELGLPPDYGLKTEDDYKRVMDIWKVLTVRARKADDDERAKTLSLCKVIITKKYKSNRSKVCPRCGQGKGQNSTHCQVCNQALHYSDQLDASKAMLHKIETTPIEIPEITHRMSELALAMDSLKNGNIGDSFITNKAASTCILMAKILGGKVTCRTSNPLERDTKKRQYRVWRVDNYSMEEVNEIIKKRLGGEKIEKPPAWVPLPPEEAEVLRKKRSGAGRPKKSERPISVPRDPDAGSGD